MTVPVAYIRRSSRASKAGDGEISIAAQESAIRELAHRDGYNGELVIFTDAGRSGDEAKIHKRSEYARMLAMIERGEVSDVYAYALDRLHRSVIGTTKLVKAVEQHGVRIVTQREGEVRNDSPDEWLRWTILSTFGEYELRISKARSKSRDDARRARGDYLGVVPFGWQRTDGKLAPNPAEDIGAVQSAYDEAGSFMGAAQLLNERKVPTRRGKWADITIARILRREGLVPEGGGGAPKTRVEHYLAGLLVCHCGTVLSPQRQKGRAEWTVYFCGNARRDKAHPRPYAIAESKVIDWVKHESSRFRVPERVALGGDPSERRDELEEDRRLAGIALRARAMPEAEFNAVMTRLDAELDALQAAESAVDVPQAIDWAGWSRGAVNGVLRSLWICVQLGPDMRPLRAEWRLPPEYIAPPSRTTTERKHERARV